MPLRSAIGLCAARRRQVQRDSPRKTASEDVDDPQRCRSETRKPYARHKFKFQTGQPAAALHSDAARVCRNSLRYWFPTATTTTSRSRPLVRLRRGDCKSSSTPRRAAPEATTRRRGGSWRAWPRRRRSTTKCRARNDAFVGAIISSRRDAWKICRRFRRGIRSKSSDAFRNLSEPKKLLARGGPLWTNVALLRANNIPFDR